MSKKYYINKDFYVGDTGKQLKDIKTNADNISSNTNNISGLKYNLITNGVAVKTGIKVDGYDEYVQRFKFGDITEAGIYKLDFDCTGKTITKWEGSAWPSGTNNWFMLGIRHDFYNNMNSIDAADVAIWASKNEKKLCCRAYNGNITRVFVNVYYINHQQ